MGGQTDHRPPLTQDTESQSAEHESRRRLAMIRLAVGGPTFMILIFGLVIGTLA